MRKIARLFAMEWSVLLQYRADLFLWVLAEASTPLVAFAIWYRISQSGAGIFSPRDTITYYTLVALMIFATGAWNGAFLAQEIRNGDIVHFLTRPLSIFWKHIANNVLEKILKLIVPALILALIWLFHPSVFSLSLPHLAFFIPSFLLAITIAFTFDMAFGLLAFWLEDVNQIRYFKYFLEELASGTLIPYAALPPLVFHVFSFFPFRYIISAPIEIFMGRTVGATAWQLLGIQSLWAIILIILLIILWRQGLKRYAVPGQ